MVRMVRMVRSLADRTFQLWAEPGDAEAPVHAAEHRREQRAGRPLVEVEEVVLEGKHGLAREVVDREPGALHRAPAVGPVDLDGLLLRDVAEGLHLGDLYNNNICSECNNNKWSE